MYITRDEASAKHVIVIHVNCNVNCEPLSHTYNAYGPNDTPPCVRCCCQILYDTNTQDLILTGPYGEWNPVQGEPRPCAENVGPRRTDGYYAIKFLIGKEECNKH